MTVTSTCAGAADTVFVRDGQTVIAEYAASTAAASTLRKYVNASYVDEPVLLIDRTAAGAVGAGTDERFYYHRNQQYSITALTDNSGTPVERYAYTAYGEPTILDGAGTTTRTTSAGGNPYLYTARAYDAESGLYYFRARMYEGRKGRFLSHDPIEYPDGSNTYAGYFADSDMDPTGNGVQCGYNTTIRTMVLGFMNGAPPLLRAMVRGLLSDTDIDYNFNLPVGVCGEVDVDYACHAAPISYGVSFLSIDLAPNGCQLGKRKRGFAASVAPSAGCRLKNECQAESTCNLQVRIRSYEVVVVPLLPVVDYDGFVPVCLRLSPGLCVRKMRGFVGVCQAPGPAQCP